MSPLGEIIKEATVFGQPLLLLVNFTCTPYKMSVQTFNSQKVHPTFRTLSFFEVIWLTLFKKIILVS